MWSFFAFFRVFVRYNPIGLEGLHQTWVSAISRSGKALTITKLRRKNFGKLYKTHEEANHTHTHTRRRREIKL